uniref:H/ACA ribonucleoprotein complex subunit n=1 Tax=Triticum aestivum TaxID=4565 RepID=A0A077S0F1_WHEAT|nr:unnamed protein product [Triticum aestivum]
MELQQAVMAAVNSAWQQGNKGHERQGGGPGGRRAHLYHAGSVGRLGEVQEQGHGRRRRPPEQALAKVSTFLHACEGDAVTKLTNEKVPYFNAPIYLQNKTQIGKVDEIFGPINESYFSVKMFEGVIATSYNEGDKFFIDPMKLLPLSRFLPQPNSLNTLADSLCERGARLQEVVVAVEEVVVAVEEVAVVDSVEEVHQGVVDLPGVEGVVSEDEADSRM